MIRQLPTSTPLPDADFPSEAVELLIAQVVFTDLLAIEKTKVGSAIQSIIATEYPFLGQEVAQTAAGSLTSWRFTDLTQRWVVSICRNSVTVMARGPATSYELLGRLARVLHALTSVAPPAAPTRVGVRCIVRSAVNDVEDAPLHADLMGLSTGLGEPRHHVSETHYGTPEGDLVLRFAKLSPGTSYAPNEIPPKPDATWVFDVDAFKPLDIKLNPLEHGPVFEVGSIIDVATDLASRAAHVAQGCLVPYSKPLNKSGATRH